MTERLHFCFHLYLALAKEGESRKVCVFERFAF